MLVALIKKGDKNYGTVLHGIHKKKRKRKGLQ